MPGPWPPGASDTGAGRIRIDGNSAPCAGTGHRRPCCGPFPSDAPVRARRSSSGIPRAAALNSVATRISYARLGVLPSACWNDVESCCHRQPLADRVAVADVSGSSARPRNSYRARSVRTLVRAAGIARPQAWPQAVLFHQLAGLRPQRLGVAAQAQARPFVEIALGLQALREHLGVDIRGVGRSTRPNRSDRPCGQTIAIRLARPPYSHAGRGFGPAAGQRPASGRVTDKRRSGAARRCTRAWVTDSQQASGAAARSRALSAVSLSADRSAGSK
ncbi:hypothetical protein FQR65_LT18344 [Abscondita terminalis]|nr:hypothetical protein FQR65_LT18344 [Abscondita terminalis]